MADLPQQQRWQIWMDRVEAVVFASPAPVPRETLARVVGKDVSVDLLVEDLQTILQGRPYQLAAVSGGWMFRTRPTFADTIRVARDQPDPLLDLSEFDAAVLTAVALHQPVSREGLRGIFGKDVNRTTIARLRDYGLITTGPRSPSSGAPFTFVTTPLFLTTFDLKSLRQLPDMGLMEDAVLPPTAAEDAADRSAPTRKHDV